MTAADATRRVREARMVAIIRLDDPGAAVEAAHAVVEGGFDVVELSLSAPDALGAIRRLADAKLPVLLGAGTVLDIDDAEAAVEAGAQWLVSPGLDVKTVAWSREQDLLHIPGVLTPTDVTEALRAGAGPVKLFPAAVFGPSYIGHLRGPFPRLEVVPTGGVDADNMTAYLDAGAVAVAFASSLVNAASAADPELLVRRARALRAAAGLIPPDSAPTKETRPCP